MAIRQSGFSEGRKRVDLRDLMPLSPGQHCPTHCPPPCAPERAGSAVPKALGPPLSIREAASMIGCSPWTVRQSLIPKGLPVFRSSASGKLIFYTNQITAWVERQQQKGGRVK